MNLTTWNEAIDGQLPEIPAYATGILDGLGFYAIVLDDDHPRGGKWLCAWDGTAEPVLDATVHLIKQVAPSPSYLAHNAKVAEEMRLQLAEQDRKAAKLAELLK